MNKWSNAVAELKGSEEYPNLYGTVKFYQKKNYVLVKVCITGLPKTESCFFGFHIHSGNSCRGEEFSGSQGHFNPTDTPHPQHAGDLPPLLLCNSGAYMTVATNRFRVKDIIGQTVIIHNMPDDFTTQPSGNAGTKIACGVIKPGML